LRERCDYTILNCSHVFGSGAGTELYRGMGTALIGGLGVSAIFTIFLVPIFLSLLMDMDYHTHKDDLIKGSLIDPREITASSLSVEKNS
jgi:HAE1 family hydrophobic/amphiphilic exporter-1